MAVVYIVNPDRTICIHYKNEFFFLPPLECNEYILQFKIKK